MLIQCHSCDNLLQIWGQSKAKRLPNIITWASIGCQSCAVSVPTCVNLVMNPTKFSFNLITQVSIMALPIQHQSSANLGPNWIDFISRSISCPPRTTLAPILCQSANPNQSLTNILIYHQSNNPLPILVQFANPLPIRQSLANLPMDYKSWTY